MRSMLLKGPALGLAAALAMAAPAAAHHRGGDDGMKAGGKAPSRVVSKARSALKAIDRADERLNDNETAKAVSQLAAARRSLASAQKTTIRKLSADNGPAAASVLFAAQGKAASELSGLFDEQTGEAVDALAQTLGYVVDQRDALVAAISALDDTAEAKYAGVMSRAANGIGDEIGDYDDALADDTLTDAAKTAITNAKTKATATKAALEARATALGSSSSNGSDDRPCPGGRGGRGDRFGDDDGGDQGPWS